MASRAKSSAMILPGLHPDLASSVRCDTVIGPLLHHPFLITTLAFALFDNCAQVNALYACKKDRIAQAVATRKYSEAISLYEKPYRFEALQAMVAHGLRDTPKAYWKTVASTWTASENVGENLRGWLALWTADLPDRIHAMSARDRAVLADLPDRVTIWRGIQGRGIRRSLSWSIDRAKGEWFARRFDHRGSGVLLRATVRKDAILAYLDHMGEHEVVVDPKDLMGMRTEPLS